MNIIERAKKLIDMKFFRGVDTKIEAYEKFLLEELKPFTELIEFNVQDLAEIHGMAATIAAQVSYDEQVNGKKIFADPALLQSYCYLSAVYAKFKSKGLTIHEVRIGDAKDHNRKQRI